MEIDFNATKDLGLSTLPAIADAACSHLKDETAISIGMLAETVAALDLTTKSNLDVIDRLQLAVRQEFEQAYEAAAGRAAIAEGETQRLTDEADALIVRADQVHARAEILPDLPEYDSLLSKLEIVANSAVPLYRLLELAPAVTETLGAGIECVLGPRVIGAIVVLPEQHAIARDCVITHGGGVEVVDPYEFQLYSRDGMRSALTDALVDSSPSALTLIARAYLDRVAGDVRILGANESRGQADASEIRPPEPDFARTVIRRRQVQIVGIDVVGEQAR
jgi:hypothetical protein